MGLTLVVCRHNNIRKFYVANLLVRGHVALGVSNLADQNVEFWPQETPELVMILGNEAQLEDDLSALHAHYHAAIPIVLVDRDQPSADWMQLWGIAAYTDNLWDSRQLERFLSPWLTHAST